MKANGVTAPSFASIEDTIQSFKQGEFIVVLDSASRENEGDLIIAASAVTPAKMAFMIRYTSGLICTPLTAARAEQLDLPQMVQHNTESHSTAYTVSVDSAASHVTTGISAHDRAATCQSLADPLARPGHFRRPGHVFPLRARAGGVLERAGHTEAAVDFCRLAGLEQVGVICELVEDGSEIQGLSERPEAGMLRRDGCLEFGRQWGLKVCTIEDLIDYIQTHEDQNL